MKKNYIVPVTNTIVIEAQAILAGSVQTNAVSGEVESVSVNGDYSDGEILSRRQGGWDD